MSDLTKKVCVACSGDMPPLNEKEIEILMQQIAGWSVVDGTAIQKIFVRENFMDAISFIQTIAAIAEKEGHHPDIRLFDYKKVEVTLTTHAIDGLSQNDFIVAAKIDTIEKN